MFLRPSLSCNHPCSCLSGHDCLNVGKCPDRGRFTRLCYERAGGLNFRAHRTCGKDKGFQFIWGCLADQMGSRIPQSRYTPDTSVAITKRSALISRARRQLAKSLSMTASIPVRNCPLSGWHMTGIPPPPVQITTAPLSSSHRIGRISKIRFGRGEGTTRRQVSPSRRNCQPFSVTIRSASIFCILGADKFCGIGKGRIGRINLDHGKKSGKGDIPGEH